MDASARASDLSEQTTREPDRLAATTHEAVVAS